MDTPWTNFSLKYFVTLLSIFVKLTIHASFIIFKEKKMEKKVGQFPQYVTMFYLSLSNSPFNIISSLTQRYRKFHAWSL